MKKSQGFTLIELVITILVLGILGAAVSHKFMGLPSDARIATLNSFVAGFKAADEIAYGKAAILGKESQLATFTIPDTNVKFQNGHLLLTSENINNAMDVDGNIQMMDRQNGDFSSVVVYLGGKEKDIPAICSSSCYIVLTKNVVASDELNLVWQQGLNIQEFYTGC